MFTIIQLLTSILILLSLFLLINIPVAMAERTLWEKYNKKYIRLSQLWFAIVGITGLAVSLTR
jgi:photosystem II core protein PsbZ